MWPSVTPASGPRGAVPSVSCVTRGPAWPPLRLSPDLRSLRPERRESAEFTFSAASFLVASVGDPQAARPCLVSRAGGGVGGHCHIKGSVPALLNAASRATVSLDDSTNRSHRTEHLQTAAGEAFLTAARRGMSVALSRGWNS